MHVLLLLLACRPYVPLRTRYCLGLEGLDGVTKQWPARYVVHHTHEFYRMDECARLMLIHGDVCWVEATVLSY